MKEKGEQVRNQVGERETLKCTCQTQRLLISVRATVPPQLRSVLNQLHSPTLSRLPGLNGESYNIRAMPWAGKWYNLEAVKQAIICNSKGRHKGRKKPRWGARSVASPLNGLPCSPSLALAEA